MLIKYRSIQLPAQLNFFTIITQQTTRNMCSSSLFPYGNAKREWTVAGILTIIYTVIFALIA
ncbi:MAG: hypothetical protein ACPH86_05365, partial [Schleiferiaceae bacterium]